MGGPCHQDFHSKGDIRENLAVLPAHPSREGCQLLQLEALPRSGVLAYTPCNQSLRPWAWEESSLSKAAALPLLASLVYSVTSRPMRDWLKDKVTVPEAAH